MGLTTAAVVSVIADHVNNMAMEPKEFCDAMSGEHRTLQQSFTRLCFSWIQHCASDDYQTDGRNEASKTVCKEIVEKVDHLYVPMV